jgi:hypothetical protein
MAHGCFVISSLRGTCRGRCPTLRLYHVRSAFLRHEPQSRPQRRLGLVGRKLEGDLDLFPHPAPGDADRGLVLASRLETLFNDFGNRTLNDAKPALGEEQGSIFKTRFIAENGTGLGRYSPAT